MRLFLKMLSGMANSIDPDQTAPSDLGLHCFPMPFLSDTLDAGRRSLVDRRVDS